jgi:hypothetical protein
MTRDIDRYERVGNSYIAYDRAGRPVGLLTNVRSINTPSRRVKRANGITERLAK